MIRRTTIFALTWPEEAQSTRPDWTRETHVRRESNRIEDNEVPPRGGRRGHVRAPRRDTDALLTAREDALRIRESLLRGDDRDALARADWLVDCIDEYLSEG